MLTHFEEGSMFDLLRFANSPKNVNLVLKWAPIISWILVAVTVGYTWIPVILKHY
jgi:hypothetical protein